jgi:hypothetical protein
MGWRLKILSYNALLAKQAAGPSAHREGAE